MTKLVSNEFSVTVSSGLSAGGVTGTIEADGQVTIAWDDVNGFGATGPSLVVFDDFRNNADGALIDLNNPTIGSWTETGTYHPIAQAAESRSSNRSQLIVKDASGTNRAHQLVSKFPAAKEWFFSFAFKVPDGVAWPTSDGNQQINGYPINSDSVWKFTWFQYADEAYRSRWSDGICLSQTPTAAGELAYGGLDWIGGKYTNDVASWGSAPALPSSYIAITHTANDLARSITLTGTDLADAPETEVVALSDPYITLNSGGNNYGTRVSVSTKKFKTITKVEVDAGTVDAIKVGGFSDGVDICFPTNNAGQNLAVAGNDNWKNLNVSSGRVDTFHQFGQWARMAGWARHVDGTNDNFFFQGIGPLGTTTEDEVTKPYASVFNAHPSDVGHITKVAFPGWMRINEDCDGILYDDIYLATGAGAAARVEIGNDPVYANCTDLALATIDSWSATSITCTLRSGGFTDFSGKYIHIHDADNNYVGSSRVIS